MVIALEKEGDTVVGFGDEARKALGCVRGIGGGGLLEAVGEGIKHGAKGTGDVEVHVGGRSSWVFAESRVRVHFSIFAADSSCSSWAGG